MTSTNGRVLIGDSVFEDATLTLRDGTLYIEFDNDDLDSVSVDLRPLLGNKTSDAHC